MRYFLLAVTAIALSSIPCHGKPPPARDQKSAAKAVTAENYLDQLVDRSVSPGDDDFFHQSENGSRRIRFLVPKLQFESTCLAKFCFASGATELRGHWHSQTEFGNEGIW
ncbi:MAG: hypothetical protein QOH01_1798 [Verrucomicrobiota bacterium]|jgi:hypothetical protein